MFSKLRQIFHWGPIVALTVIFMISGVGLKCLLMWWPVDRHGGLIHLVIYLQWVVTILYNYFLAAFKGPGFVPQGWKPKKKEDMEYLQYCNFCEGFKCPRSHHCRKCDRCVMKMDHHCPWINTCCGHFNHANFVWFLFLAPLGCCHALIVLIPSTYRALHWHWYIVHTSDPVVHLGIAGFILAMFSIGLAIGVIIAVGTLFVIQMRSILRNETGIETWIITKALDREREEDEGEFIYPYDLGWRRNFWQVFTWSGYPKSDGFTWDVVKGCDQFTFTYEQIQQKAQKRERTLEYTIVMKYSGSLIPMTFGCKVCYTLPCTDEPRIALNKGDKVLVTRWKKHWLYGTRILTDEQKKAMKKTRIRGWFPRICAKELICNHDENDHIEYNDTKKEK